MTKVVINTDKAKNDLIPLLTNSKDYLEKSINILSNIKVPSDYMYIKEINSIITDINKTYEKLSEFSENFQREIDSYNKINDLLLEELNSVKKLNIIEYEK